MQDTRAAYVIISHDRAFLRALTRATLWIARGEVRRNERGFDAFEDWRETVWAEEDLARHKLDRKIKAEARWAVEGISARRQRNQGRVRRLAELRLLLPLVEAVGLVMGQAAVVAVHAPAAVAVLPGPPAGLDDPIGDHVGGCVEVEAAYYSVPPGWIGRRVQVQWTDLHVRVLVLTTGELLREHVRTKRGWHRIDDSDRSPRTPATTLALLARASHAGPHLHAVCTTIQAREGAAGVRRILGVLSLAKRFGPAAADEAAKVALDLEAPNYRFLRRYLERIPPAPLTLRQVDPLIRQLTLYRDLIDRTTGDPA